MDEEVPQLGEVPFMLDFLSQAGRNAVEAYIEYVDDGALSLCSTTFLSALF